MAETVTTTFQSAVEEGRRRLRRTPREVLATGVVGGLDLGIGVIALLVVHHATGSKMLAALAFGIGFIALVLANSELFTENFLVPIAALVTGKATGRQVAQLWLGTLVGNLLGGWLVMAIAMSALPDLHGEAREFGTFYADLGITWEAFALALLGGVAITLMTWMERGSSTVGPKLVAAVSIAFVLVAAPLNHSIVGSLEMFAALQTGASFGYADWLGAFVLAVAGNVIGGVGLVTLLRLAQLPPNRFEEEKQRPVEEVDERLDAEDEAATEGPADDTES